MSQTQPKKRKGKKEGKKDGKKKKKQDEQLESALRKAKESATQERLEQEQKENAQKKPKKEAPMTLRRKLWWAAIGIAVLGSLVMLRINQEQYGWSGIERDKGDGAAETSYYEILEVSHSATTKEIKKAYKKLALKYHPDRNKNCGSHCEEMTVKINKAYDTLSDESKRQIYDATEGSIKSIASSAIELTYENFDDYVKTSRGLFVIQVYTEWYKECADFAPIWEEALHRFSGYVEFGRVHGSRQLSVVKQLGTAIRDYPTVVSFVDGRFERVYPAVRYPNDLFDLIVDDYPTRHLWIGTEENMETIYSKWNRKQNVPLFMVASKKIQPSLLVSWLARQYESILQFAHVYPKPMSKSNAQQTKVSTGRVRFLSNSLTEYFGTDKFTQLPKLITISGSGATELVDEQINKDNLQKYTSRYVAKMVPQLSTWTYTTICTQHDIVCILYIKGCDKSSSDSGDSSAGNGTASSGKKTSYLREFKTLANHGITEFKEIEESFHPKWIQFAYTKLEASRPQNSGLNVLCTNDDTEVVLINEGAQTMTQLDTSLAEITKEEFWEWVHSNLNHESETIVVDAPRVIPPPPERMSYGEMIREYIDEFDWRSADFQLNVIIIGVMIAGVFIIKYIGCAGCVWFIFALSIFGGVFQTFLMKGGPSPQPSSRGRRGGKR